ncbi:MAG: hypothetical protein K2K32_07915 [Muribaculaceae bacterium]|nr:hypothetical protein [Muribaculaceae bacterium]
MKNWLRDFLVDGLNDSLSENSLAWRLYSIVNSGDFVHLSREEIWSTLTADNSPKQAIKSTDDVSPDKMRDCRFRNLCLQNVKRFPGKENGRYYGLSFLKNGYPTSSVFLGANGVGKSSIYAALEYIGMRKSNTAALRGYYSDNNEILDFNQSKFLTHVSSPPTDVKMYLETETALVKIDGIKSDDKKSAEPLICDAFYCSDYDVRQLETCRDYSDYLIGQLGFGLYDKCIQILYYTKARIDSQRRSLSENKNTSSFDESELTLRLSVAQAMGSLHIKKWTLNSLSKNNDSLNDFLKGLSSGDTFTAETINALRNTLNIELQSFPEKKWFTNLIFKFYSDLDSSLKQIAAEKDNRERELLSKDIERLFKVRTMMLSTIEQNLRTLKKIDPEQRDSYINKQIDNLTNYKIKQSQSEQFAKQFSPFVTDDDKNTSFNKEFEQLITFLEHRFRNTLEGWMSKVEICIKELLSGYFEPDNDLINIKWKFNPYSSKDAMDLEYDSTKKIFNHLDFSIKILSSGGILDKTEGFIERDPRDYLNTFKFKLFCVSLKMAFCCVAKDIYNTNFPLVIDDVFDASDFENRIQLKNFIRKLLLKHDEFLPVLKKKHQFIFFTQDDIIATQVAKGIKFAYDSDVKFGHIFDYHELNCNKESETDRGDENSSERYKIDMPLKIILSDQEPHGEIKFYQMDDELSFS